MTAFFLEAGFLGIMLLGWNRVNKKVHFFATLMVAVGTLISATWIVGANSWLHTPAGFKVSNGQFFIVEWWHALFNPSFYVRYPHMLLASMFTASFLIAGISAWYLLKEKYTGFARTCYSIVLGVITILIPVQLWVGDTLAIKMSVYQPAKLQAMEGYWEDTPTAPYLLFINPDPKNQRNNTQIGIPYLGSILVVHNLHGTVPGLKRTPPKEQPNMAMTFYFSRIMILIGILMFFVALTSISLRFTGKLFTKRWFLKLSLWMTPAGVIATVAGWITSETGRQPYVIYGLLRTAETSSSLSNFQVIFSFGLFLIVYTVLLAAYIIFVCKIVKKGPETIQDTIKTNEHKKDNFISGLPETIKLSVK
jgi:cytochrome d ubiquinol oxidase subunit I